MPFPDGEDALHTAKIGSGRAGRKPGSGKQTGNGVGLTKAEFDALSPSEQTEATNRAEAELFEAGAHYVVDSAANALPILDEIEAALSAGNRP